jgi:ABC-2 type transport system permease protein
VIARREYVDSVHSRAFLLGIMLPAGLFIVMLLLGDQPAGRGAGAAGRGAIGGYGAFIFMFLLFMGILGMGKHMLTSLIEEKSSRIIEVLLSAVSPLELMAGKILGLGAAGLTAVGIATAFIWSAARYRGVVGIFELRAVAYLIVYYVLGFLVSSSVFAAVGSACNKMRDAQAMLFPLTIPFVLPLVFWMSIASEPHGLLALVFSFLPPTAAPTMIVRLMADPGLPALQVVASLVVLGLSVPLSIGAAGRVFRTAILVHGKPPTLREIARWALTGD